MSKLPTHPPPPPPPQQQQQQQQQQLATQAFVAAVTHSQHQQQYHQQQQQQQPQQQQMVPRESKELFVGNLVASGVTEAVLKDFLNNALRQVGFASNTEEPVVAIRMNAKFGFICFGSIEDTNKALNLDGIPFMGSMLKIKRPAKYAGPVTSSRTWQEMTGHATAGAAAGATVVVPISEPNTKNYREIFVGNTTEQITEQVLKEFIGTTLLKMGLSCSEGSPINQVRVNGKFCFLEFKTMEEAANVLNLNGIPFLGTNLKLSRPSKFDGALIEYFSWDDLLSRWMTGEIKLMTAGPTSTILCITNMIASVEELDDEELYAEVIEDTRIECSQYGTVSSVVIPRKSPVASSTSSSPPTRALGRVFVEMSSDSEAQNVLVALKGRAFDGRIVDVKFYPPQAFASSDYGAPFAPIIVTTKGALPLDAVVPPQIAQFAYQHV